jgi:hypothetical protein
VRDSTLNGVNKDEGSQAVPARPSGKGRLKRIDVNLKQEVLERTNLPTFLTLFKNVNCIKTSVCSNITSVGNSVPILKHSHIQNNVSNKRIVGSS